MTGRRGRCVMTSYRSVRTLMPMSEIAGHVREAVLSYLAGAVELEELQDWVLENTWDHDPDADDIVAPVLGALGLWDAGESDLVVRELLRDSIASVVTPIIPAGERVDAADVPFRELVRAAEQRMARGGRP